MTALLVAAVVCFLGVFACVALSVATGTPHSIAGLVTATPGRGAELASAGLLPTTPLVVSGLAALLYGSMVVVARRHRRDR